jgi:hypothetical protein
MCVDPATLAVVSAAASVLGTGVSAYGQIQAGQAAKAAGDYNAAVARNNQIVAERQAQDALARGEVAETEQRRKVRMLASSQRAALGASGVQLDAGTPLDLLGDTAAMGELDALTIRNNAEREAYGYRVQGVNFGAEAGLQTMRGNNAMSGALMSAGGTVLSGAGNVADRWLVYNRLGMTGGGEAASGAALAERKLLSRGLY